MQVILIKKQDINFSTSFKKFLEFLLCLGFSVLLLFVINIQQKKTLHQGEKPFVFI